MAPFTVYAQDADMLLLSYSLTFISKAFSEGVLLRVAYAFEQLSAVRENGPLPFKLPTRELKDV